MFCVIKIMILHIFKCVIVYLMKCEKYIFADVLFLKKDGFQACNFGSSISGGTKTCELARHV